MLGRRYWLANSVFNLFILLIKKVDILTKPLAITHFLDLRSKLSIISMILSLRDDIDMKDEKEFKLLDE